MVKMSHMSFSTSEDIHDKLLSDMVTFDPNQILFLPSLDFERAVS